MEQTCPIFNKSLRFSKTVYGVLALAAYFIQGPVGTWMILGISVLMIIEMYSIKLSIPYQLHVWFAKKFLKQEEQPVQEEKGKISFVCGMAGIPLFGCFFLLYFGTWVGFAWAVILMFSILLLLSGIVGLCVASLSYAIFKKFLKRKK
jgi:hypothetical protein